MLSKLKLLTLLIAISGLISIVSAQHDHDHEGLDHNSETNIDQTEDHATHDDYEENSDELLIQLTPEAIELAGIQLSTVKRGRISNTIDLHGEIGFNEDRLVHIAPRFAGIAIKAKVKVGEYVDEGSEVAVIESNESMNVYSIKSPISGWVIERHITPGEYVSQENSIFVIADLSTVWVNLAVYPKDADRIVQGQIADISAIGSDHSAQGFIEYVTPVIDQKTRNATARTILSNPDNTWRPGTFVHAKIANGSDGESLIIEKDAVQYLDKNSVVFVKDGPSTFKSVEVVIGKGDNEHIQVLDGIQFGTEYVSHGSFELKAKIITSNLDPHAGHGH